MKYVISSVLAAVMMAIGFIIVPPANAAVTTNIMIPVQSIVTPQFVPCANNGNGEFLDFSGTLHILALTTLDNSGGAHVKLQFQPQGVIATGQTTGDIWHGTGLTIAFVANTHVGSETSFVNNFRLIGPGSTVNFIVHEVMHITVNPDGTVTASFDNFSTSCG
jgi:hypothetical protein